MARLEILYDNSDTIDLMNRQGIPFPVTAKLDIPVLPSDLSDLSDQQIMELFGQLTAYWNFLSAQHAVAVIDERAAEKALDMAESIAMLKAHDGKAVKDTVTLLKAKVASDPEIVEHSKRYDSKYNYRKLIEVMVDNAERDTNLVSRELTRRTSGSSTRSRGNWMMP